MVKLIYLCEICDTLLDEHNCKAICPNCGRMLDCSDLPFIQADGIYSERSDEIKAGEKPKVSIERT